jgi:hypothetical protein
MPTNIFRLFKSNIKLNREKLERDIQININTAFSRTASDHVKYVALWDALQAKRKLDELPTTEDVVALLQHAGWKIDDIKAMVDGE